MSLFFIVLKTCPVSSKYNRSVLGELLQVSGTTHEPVLDPNSWTNSLLCLIGFVMKLGLNIVENQLLLSGF